MPPSPLAHPAPRLRRTRRDARWRIRNASIPAIARLDVAVPRARTRCHQHLRGLLVPLQVVRGFLVLHGRLGVAVDLVEHETRRVLLLLEKIEARDSRLLRALGRVDPGGGDKCIDEFRLDVSLNDENEHTLY